MSSCVVSGCSSRPRALGYCKSHYTRFRKYGDPLAGRVGNGGAEAWLLNAIKLETDDCIEWPFSTSGGYGRVRHNGVSGPASRFVCLLVHGTAPSPGHQAAHTCGNRGCVNHRHIRWASQAENEEDKIVHGTVCRGERANLARLTEESVIGMRNDARRGVSFAELAEVHDVDVSTVRNAVSGRTWAWLHSNEIEDINATEKGSRAIGE